MKKDETDLKLLGRLKKILDAVEEEADHYYHNKKRDYKDYQEYRDSCYSEASDPFWDIARQKKTKFDWYDPESSHMESMKAFYEAFDDVLHPYNRVPEWLAKALEEDDDTNEEDDGD